MSSLTMEQRPALAWSNSGSPSCSMPKHAGGPPRYQASKSLFRTPLSCNVKLIDFDAAKELKQADEILERFLGNLDARSPERAHQRPCRTLAEDAYMTGYAFFTLLKEAPADRAAEKLRARVMPLLRRAEQRLSVQQILEHWNALDLEQSDRSWTRAGRATSGSSSEATGRSRSLCKSSLGSPARHGTALRILLAKALANLEPAMKPSAASARQGSPRAPSC